MFPASWDGGIGIVWSGGRGSGTSGGDAVGSDDIQIGLCGGFPATLDEGIGIAQCDMVKIVSNRERVPDLIPQRVSKCCVASASPATYRCILITIFLAILYKFQKIMYDYATKLLSKCTTFDSCVLNFGEGMMDPMRECVACNQMHSIAIISGEQDIRKMKHMNPDGRNR